MSLKKKNFLCYPSPKATGEYKIQQFLKRFLQTNSSSIAWELARDAGSSGCAPDLLNESPLRWPRYLGFNEPAEAVVQTHPCHPRSGLSSHHSLRHPVPQPPQGPSVPELWSALSLLPQVRLLCSCSRRRAPKPTVSEELLEIVKTPGSPASSRSRDSPRPAPLCTPAPSPAPVC